MSTLNALPTELPANADKSVSPYDPVLELATSRLHMDEELRLDVMQELRAHLEDSAAEYRAAGLAEHEAQERAIKALGDANDLSQQLWSANLRRMRLRRVLKWTAQVALLPIAIVLTLAIISSVGSPVSAISQIWDGNSRKQFALAPFADALDRIFSWPGSRDPQPLLQGLTDEQRFLFQGDPKITDPILREKSISDRWPDNPVYYANYINRRFVGLTSEKLEALAPATRDALLLELDHGERLEPGNALYNFLKAELLLAASSRLTDHPTRTTPVLASRPGDQPVPCSQIQISDPTLLQRGLDEFRRGCLKPHLTSHSIAMGKLRLDQLPPSRFLADEVNRTAFSIALLLPTLNLYRDLANRTSAYAVHLADADNPDQAELLLRQVYALGAKIGVDSNCIIDVLVAQSITHHALTYAAIVNDTPDRAPRHQQAMQLLHQAMDFHNQQLRPAGNEIRMLPYVHSSMLTSMLLPAIGGYTPADPTPLRRAEYAIADRVALAWLMLMLVALAIGIGLIALVFSLLRRRTNRPLFLFVGWHRLARICLLAIVAPLAAYTLYAYLTPLGGRQLGVHVAGMRLLVEYLALTAVIFGLLQQLSYTAIRQRALELGIPVPPPASSLARRSLWVGLGALTLGILACLIAWHVRARDFDTQVLYGENPADGYFTAVALLIAAAGVFFTAHRWYGHAQFHRTLLRSAVPILAAAVIVLGVVCGLALRQVETAAASQSHFSRTLFEEIERSNCRHLRNRLVEQHQKLLAELPASTSASAG